MEKNRDSRNIPPRLASKQALKQINGNMNLTNDAGGKLVIRIVNNLDPGHILYTNKASMGITDRNLET